MIIDLSIVLFALVIASVIYFFMQDRQLVSGLKTFLKEGNYKTRAISPIASPFTRKLPTRVVCYDGLINPDTPYTLILGARHTGEGKNRISYRYIGFYFPPQEKFSDEWLNGWKQKVAERGDQWSSDLPLDVDKTENKWGVKGPPDSLPIRAERVEGGVLIAWNGLHTYDHIQARINDVLTSL